MSIGLRHEGSGVDFFDQCADRVIFAALVFVAHYGHFRGEVCFQDAEIAHTIGLEFDGQRYIVAGEGSVVVGAVEVSGGIGARADTFHLAGIVGTIAAVKALRALEHHVLKNMGGPGGASDFIARADVVGHHDRGYRQALVGH